MDIDNDSCQVCMKTFKYILVHLKNNPDCQEHYDMVNLRTRVGNMYKERKKQKQKSKRRERYNVNKEREKEKRKLRYNVNKEREKEKRKIRYNVNKEREKEKRKLRYKDKKGEEKAKEKLKYNEQPMLKEKKKMYNKVYHQVNRENILPRMNRYNLSYKSRRSAVNKFKREISEYQKNWYLLEEAFHLYHHSHGKCDLSTIKSGRHTLQKYDKVCQKCAGPMFKLSGCNKIQCVSSLCGMAICHVCQLPVPSHPLKDFEHFFLDYPLMTGMCPLYEDFNSFSGHKCSSDKPCYLPEPSAILLNDYNIQPWHLPSIACEICKTVEKENPAIVEACRKVQKYGFYPNHRLKCSRIKRDLTDKEKKYFLENKEYHFYNCNICGWTTNEEHSIWGRRFDGFTYENFEIPISVDQKVFFIDYPESPENCWFGNELISLKDPYVNFEHNLLSDADLSPSP